MENIFQRPPILMRLTMLTRDKMSLLRAASLRTARETARGLNDRKQRGWVEAGILPLNYSRFLCIPLLISIEATYFIKILSLQSILSIISPMVRLENRQ